MTSSLPASIDDIVENFALLDEWDDVRRSFVKVMPTEYRKVLESMQLDSEAQKLAAV